MLPGAAGAHAHRHPARPQIKDKWGFRMTARHEVYAELFARYTRHDFVPQIIKDPAA